MMNIGILHHDRPSLERVRQSLAELSAEVWIVSTSPPEELGPMMHGERHIIINEEMYYPLLFFKRLLAALRNTDEPMLVIESDVIVSESDMKQISGFGANCYFLYKELSPSDAGAYGRKRTMSMYLTAETVSILAQIFAEMHDAILRVPLHCEPSFISTLLALAPSTRLRLTHITHGSRSLATQGLLARTNGNAQEPALRHAQRALMRDMAFHMSPKLCRAFFTRILNRIRPSSAGAAVLGVNGTSMLLADMISEDALIKFVIDSNYPSLSKTFANKEAIFPTEISGKLHQIDTVIIIGQAEEEAYLVAESLKLVPKELKLIPLRYTNWSSERDRLPLDVLSRFAFHNYGYFTRLFSVLLDTTGGVDNFRATFSALADAETTNSFDVMGVDALEHWNHL